MVPGFDLEVRWRFQLSKERRRRETAGLRRFFQDHLDQISNLIDRHSARRDALRQREILEKEALESVVTGTDTRLRTVSSYRKRMRDGVRTLLDYVEDLIARLPPSLSVDQKSFLSDPRVNAFFVNRESIRGLFSRSPEMQDFFSAPQNSHLEHACAIMFMSRNEKQVFATGMSNGLLIRDVKQTTVSFSDHSIIHPRATEPEVRSALERLLFERYVEYIDYQLAFLNANLGRKVLNDPSIYLEALVRVLERPEELLTLESSTMRVNRVGVRVTGDSSEAANDITLHELCMGVQGRQVVTLVIYPRSEMESRDALLRAAELSLL